MKYCQLGTNGARVSAIGLGCMPMAGDYGLADEGEAVFTIHRALELGVTLLDTADAYGKGTNEELLGRALKGHRQSVMLATKGGAIVNADSSPGVNGRPDYIRLACEASLRRLAVEVIDLYYLHRVDPNTPIEDTTGAMARLAEAGKIRYLGLSEAGPATIRRAHAVHPITALQTEYSLWCREVEEEVLPLCRELGIGFVAYSPLGRGFLSATVRAANVLSAGDRRATMPRFQGENLARNVSLLAALETLANGKKCSPAQVALAWLLTRGNDVIPIPGTKRVRHLEENVAALDIRLSARDLASLDGAFARGSARGDRYGAAQMEFLNL